MDTSTFQNAVLRWYDRHGRKHLPWQNPQTPYRVWISEIMLQQTQVETVIDFFQRFMTRFPDIEVLAKSDIDTVLSLWAGLGYYARARNLHKTAVIVADQHKGQFPETLEALTALPGIGRSTAGAILTLGLGKSAAILDGNVRRVLARHDAVEGWPGQSTTQKALWTLSEKRTPVKRAAHYNQAMMDLGALICRPKSPNCNACPLEETCLARQRDSVHLFPARRPNRALPVRKSFWLILKNQRGEIYLEQRPPSGLWGGLLAFPEFESLEALLSWANEFSGRDDRLEYLPERRHTFSHFHLDHIPVVITTEDESATPSGMREGHFHAPNQVKKVPTPVKYLLGTLTPSPDGP